MNELLLTLPFLRLRKLTNASISGPNNRSHPREVRMYVIHSWVSICMVEIFANFFRAWKDSASGSTASLAVNMQFHQPVSYGLRSGGGFETCAGHPELLVLLPICLQLLSKTGLVITDYTQFNLPWQKFDLAIDPEARLTYAVKFANSLHMLTCNIIFGAQFYIRKCANMLDDA